MLSNKVRKWSENDNARERYVWWRNLVCVYMCHLNHFIDLENMYIYVVTCEIWHVREILTVSSFKSIKDTSIQNKGSSYIFPRICKHIWNLFIDSYTL